MKDWAPVDERMVPPTRLGITTPAPKLGAVTPGTEDKMGTGER